MLLVQLSDVHVSNGFRRDMLEQAIDEVNSIAPDVVVVTGDITDNGILQEYEKARAYISKLKCNNIIMLAGNHDYRNTGYLLFKRFFAPKQVYEDDQCMIATLSTARPDRDEGEVGYRQNLWLLNTLTDASKDGKVKIIAMHHHLIPIPDTGSDRIIVLDAGDVLQTALEAGVNLVLCGHKHRPWIWQLGSLTIAYAGTVSSERMRGFFKNSYNIVDVRKDRVEITLKVVGGESMSLKDIVKAREVMVEG